MAYALYRIAFSLTDEWQCVNTVFSPFDAKSNIFSTFLSSLITETKFLWF